MHIFGKGSTPIAALRAHAGKGRHAMPDQTCEKGVLRSRRLLRCFRIIWTEGKVTGGVLNLPSF